MNSQQPAMISDATEQALQDRVFEFLEHSGFGPAGRAKRIDTHASVVFLGGDRALKIKRAVRLPFLDYSTLEKRRDACEEELKVNAGNAPELYRRVVAITRGDDGFLEVGGSGVPVEWAVEMARADGESWLASIPGIIDRNIAKFREVRGLNVAAIEQLAARSQDYLSKVRVLLERRAALGFVRRCHGDLHLANIALVDGRPRPGVFGCSRCGLPAGSPAGSTCGLGASAPWALCRPVHDGGSRDRALADRTAKARRIGCDTGSRPAAGGHSARSRELAQGRCFGNAGGDAAAKYRLPLCCRLPVGR